MKYLVLIIVFLASLGTIIYLHSYDKTEMSLLVIEKKIESTTLYNEKGEPNGERPDFLLVLYSKETGNFKYYTEESLFRVAQIGQSIYLEVHRLDYSTFWIIIYLICVACAIGSPLIIIMCLCCGGDSSGGDYNADIITWSASM